MDRSGGARIPSPEGIAMVEDACRARLEAGERHHAGALPHW